MGTQPNCEALKDSIIESVAQVVDEATLKLAVWERPGMLTQACSTGACVAAPAARLQGLITGDEVSVLIPG